MPGARVRRPGPRAGRRRRRAAAGTRCPTARRTCRRLWRARGHRRRSTVVVYDGGPGWPRRGPGGCCAGRGVPDVRVLDGGLPGLARRTPARPIAAGPGRGAGRRPATVTVAARARMPVVDVDGAAELAGSRGRSGVLVDARAARPLPRRGRAARPGGRAHPRRGEPADRRAARPGRHLPAGSRGARPRRSPRPGCRPRRGPALAAASCGSGVTACQLVLAGEIAGLGWRCSRARTRSGARPAGRSRWATIGRPRSRAADGTSGPTHDAPAAALSANRMLDGWTRPAIRPSRGHHYPGAMTAPLVVWDPRMLGYDLGGNHPLHPLRWELTWALAGELGVLDALSRCSRRRAADDETLGRIHTPGVHRGGARRRPEELPGSGRARAGHRRTTRSSRACTTTRR